LIPDISGSTLNLGGVLQIFTHFLSGVGPGRHMQRAVLAGGIDILRGSWFVSPTADVNLRSNGDSGGIL